MVLEKGTGDHAELIRCASLAEALTAIAARAVPSGTMPTRRALRSLPAQRAGLAAWRPVATDRA